MPLNWSQSDGRCWCGQIWRLSVHRNLLKHVAKNNVKTCPVLMCSYLINNKHRARYNKRKKKEIKY